MKGMFGLVAVTLFTAGCASFFPAYQDGVGANVSSGFEIVSELVATTELGDFSDPSSYTDAAPRYAQALASFETARTLAAAARASGPAVRAATKVDESLRNCTEAVTIMAADHKASGLPDGVGYVNVRNTCALPFTILKN